MRISKTCRFLIGAALVALSSTCRAQGPAVLTAEDTVRQALSRNQRIQALQSDLQAARHQVRGAGALANPELAYVPPITDSGSDEEFIFRQPLEINGARRIRAQIARSNSSARHAEARAEALDLVADTRAAYYRLALARENLALARFLETNAEMFHSAVERQVELGSRPGIERTQTGLELARIRLEVKSALADEQSAEAALNALMGLPPDTPVPELAKLTTSSESPPQAADLADVAARRPEAQVERALADAARAEKDLARAEGRPDIAPQIRADEVGDTGSFGIGIAITLPFIDHGARRARIQEAQAEADAHERRAEALQTEMAAQARQAELAAEEAAARAAAYETDLLDQARRLLDASRVGLEEGRTGILAVLEAQRTYREIETERIEALVDLALARVALQRALAAYPAEEALLETEVTQ